MNLKVFAYLIGAIFAVQSGLANGNFRSELFIDESGLLEVSDVQESTQFVLLESNSVFNNFTDANYWVKISPTDQFNDSDRILFSNSYNHYESIYLIYRTDSVVKKNFGANQLSDSKTYIPSFNLDKDVTEIFISISSDTFLYESFQILNEEDVNRIMNNYLLFQILFLGFVISILIYMLILFVKSRKAVIGRYILYLCSTLCMFLFVSNLGRYFFWNELPFTTSYLEISFSFFMVWAYLRLTIKITKIERHNLPLKNICNAFLILSCFTILVSMIFFHPRYLSLLANIIPLIGLLFLIIFAIVGLKKGNSQAGIYLFGIISFIVGMFTRVLINWGIIPYSLLVDTFIFMGLIVELVLFSYVVIAYIEQNIKMGVNHKFALQNSNKLIRQLQNDLEKLSHNKKTVNAIDLDNFETLINENLYEPLTQREIDVLKELVGGESQKEIAEKLFISISTLKTHASRIYSKLDSKNRVEAIQKVSILLNQK